jgi:hypothetical protein
VTPPSVSGRGRGGRRGDSPASGAGRPPARLRLREVVGAGGAGGRGRERGVARLSFPRRSEGGVGSGLDLSGAGEEEGAGTKREGEGRWRRARAFQTFLAQKTGEITDF